MTTNSDTADALREEILKEARRQGEEIVSRARYDAEVSLAAAAREAEKMKEEKFEQARAEEARQRETILATVPVETGRMEAERREVILESVREESLRRLNGREGFDYRQAVVVLASEALGRMTGNAFVVKVPGSDRSVLGDGVAGEIARRLGRPEETITVSYEADLTGGGVVIEDGEGRQIWDNRFTGRLMRMWPALRQQVAVEASFIEKKESGEESP